MGDTISLTTEEQRRGRILAHLVAGDLTIEEAAAWLGVSVRQAWRLRARFLAEGPAALAHGNRGRASPRRIERALRARVVELATSDDYRGANDSHLTELLAERVPTLHLAGGYDPDYFPNITFRGPTTLHLGW